jgi:hypothetical protein
MVKSKKTKKPDQINIGLRQSTYDRLDAYKTRRFEETNIHYSFSDAIEELLKEQDLVHLSISPTSIPNPA